MSSEPPKPHEPTPKPNLLSPPPHPPPTPLTIPLNSTLVIRPDLRHVELEVERYLKLELEIKLDTDQQLCQHHLNSLNLDASLSNPTCQSGSNCALRHVDPSPLNFIKPQVMGLHSKTVCKHWLRGLCKKGNGCEFLHEYNLRTMPECWFFGKYGFCSNGDECMYLHVDERMRVLECMDFRRGFCPKGLSFFFFFFFFPLQFPYSALYYTSTRVCAKHIT